MIERGKPILIKSKLIWNQQQPKEHKEEPYLCTNKNYLYVMVSRSVQCDYVHWTKLTRGSTQISSNPLGATTSIGRIASKIQFFSFFFSFLLSYF